MRSSLQPLSRHLIPPHPYRKTRTHPALSSRPELPVFSSAPHFSAPATEWRDRGTTPPRFDNPPSCPPFLSALCARCVLCVTPPPTACTFPILSLQLSDPLPH